MLIGAEGRCRLNAAGGWGGVERFSSCINILQHGVCAGLPDTAQTRYQQAADMPARHACTSATPQIITRIASKYAYNNITTPGTSVKHHY